MEEAYSDVVQLENQKLIPSLTFCAIAVCLINIGIFLQLSLGKSYNRLPIIQYQSAVSIFICAAWIAFSIVSYLFVRTWEVDIRHKRKIVFIGFTHYVLSVVLYLAF